MSMSRIANHRCCNVVLVMAATLLIRVCGAAQSGPQPPCGTDAVPTYPEPENSPAVKFWATADFGKNWKAPACTAWAATGFGTLVTTVAKFPSPMETSDLLQHIGAISKLTGMRYWSTTHGQWQTLIVYAHAVTGPQSPKPRKDFTPEEMKPGQVLYF